MVATDLFNEVVITTPKTEGIKYAGSKLKLLPYILALTKKYPIRTVFDGFTGTTRVAQAFAKLEYTVFANDISVWSKVFSTCYLLNRHPKLHYTKMIEHLNNLPGIDGWFTQHYGGTNSKASDNENIKKPWQIHNTLKLDAIREEIDNMNLAEEEKAVLITSLIYAMDDVDSTLGHYASYLNEWSPRSYNTMKLHVPELIVNPLPHQVLIGDTLNVVSGVEADLAYYDPPYGSNNEKMPPSRVRYASYYHLWTTICLNDKPELFGKVNRRSDSGDKEAGSVFEDFRKGASGRFIVVEAIDKLLAETKANFILLSYSSGGRATKTDLVDVLESSGEILEFTSVNYKKNVMANMRWTHEWINNDEPNQEYLFLIEKK